MVVYVSVEHAPTPVCDVMSTFSGVPSAIDREGEGNSSSVADVVGELAGRSAHTFVVSIAEPLVHG